MVVLWKLLTSFPISNLFYYNNNFTVAEKTHLADQGRKSTFTLYSETKMLYLNTETQLSLFDCYIPSIIVICYVSEIW